MSKWVREKNKRLRESADWVPFEVYKATRPKSRSRKSFAGRFVHVSAEVVRDKFGKPQTDSKGNTKMTKGVTFKLPQVKQQSTKRV